MELDDVNDDNVGNGNIASPIVLCRLPSSIFSFVDSFVFVLFFSYCQFIIMNNE